ncbi:alpha/beta hydrolase [Streptomyces thermolineatus]|uniref:Alpha/beta hydrolase n=1 Tax=Streptomyces thermolineatus TaxID=44033 RepID=A0ABN3MSL8_9ACTN
MARARANGTELEYDTFGDPADPALLLVMGLGMQMTAWQESFCTALAGRGFFVVRHDNRDAGLSTAFDDAPPVDFSAVRPGDRSTVPYLLEDMAADSAGLLDALGVPAAHVVGASMGGMICQQLAVDHPSRVLSLCSIMSTTGDPSVGRADPKVASHVLFSAPAPDREAVIDWNVRTLELIGSPRYPVDEEVLRRMTADAFDRSYRPAGTARQLAAIMASPDRTGALGSVTVPTLVVHGEEDPLIHVSGGEATAAAVPGAELLLLPGMGHDLPVQLEETVADAIARNASRAAGGPAPAA